MSPCVTRSSVLVASKQTGRSVYYLEEWLAERNIGIIEDDVAASHGDHSLLICERVGGQRNPTIASTVQPCATCQAPCWVADVSPPDAERCCQQCFAERFYR